MVNRPPVPLAPDVKEMLNRWRPTTWDDFDVWTLEPLLPTIRGWVEQAKPGTAAKTRQFLLAASGMAMWAYQSFGNIDPTVVFHPSNIEQWAIEVCADRSMRWRGSYPEQAPHPGTGRQPRRVSVADAEGGQTTDRPTVHHT